MSTISVYTYTIYIPLETFQLYIPYIYIYIPYIYHTYTTYIPLENFQFQKYESLIFTQKIMIR